MSMLRPLSLLCLTMLCLTTLLAGCYSVPPEVRKTPVTPQADPAPPRVGGDRDAHGCIPSAGYTWCAHENACVRPWELAKAKGFANTSDAFGAYCAASRAK